MEHVSLSDGVLSATWRSKLLKRLGASALLCVRCGGEISLGSKIHLSYGCRSLRHNQWMQRSKIPRIYHTECFEDMFID